MASFAPCVIRHGVCIIRSRPRIGGADIAIGCPWLRVTDRSVSEMDMQHPCALQLRSVAAVRFWSVWHTLCAVSAELTHESHVQLTKCVPAVAGTSAFSEAPAVIHQ